MKNTISTMKNSLKEKANLSKEKVKKISQAVWLTTLMLIWNGCTEENNSTLAAQSVNTFSKESPTYAKYYKDYHGEYEYADVLEYLQTNYLRDYYGEDEYGLYLRKVNESTQAEISEVTQTEINDDDWQKRLYLNKTYANPNKTSLDTLIDEEISTWRWMIQIGLEKEYLAYKKLNREKYCYDSTNLCVGYIGDKMNTTGRFYGTMSENNSSWITHSDKLEYVADKRIWEKEGDDFESIISAKEEDELDDRATWFNEFALYGKTFYDQSDDGYYEKFLIADTDAISTLSDAKLEEFIKDRIEKKEIMNKYIEYLYNKIDYISDKEISPGSVHFNIGLFRNIRKEVFDKAFDIRDLSVEQFERELIGKDYDLYKKNATK